MIHTDEVPEHIQLYFQEGRSDKIYIVDLRLNEEGKWEVFAQWGRRGRSMQSQIKIRTKWYFDAAKEYRKLVLAKKDKGYLVLDDSHAELYGGMDDSYEFDEG
jgi:predicted DNA-binding WGR domain protein